MNKETATLAGGCFWCTEAIFKRLKGILSIASGYAGGAIPNPTYKEVCSGTTGHAESIQIIFNPSIIPYEKILDIFWHMHNPTTINQQGADIGSQYRSVIFYHSNAQKQTAEKSKRLLDEAHIYNNPIVTQIIPFTSFYKAEESHQNYYDRNSSYPYCQFVIDPKIQKLLKEYAADVKEDI